ncbi:hypothetical protein HY798_05135 [Candidatus Falkowbacteria bacterium]|nr:hypothetical protein [Candidatus Falkowbacteria bacterium]
MELNEKNLKSVLRPILTDQREECQRYLGALKEDFDSKLEIIGEQYFDIKKILDSHTKILDSHTKTLDSHTKTLESHTEMIVSIKEDAEIIKLDIEFIKNELRKKVDWDEFAALEKRVALIESRLKGAIA